MRFSKSISVSKGGMAVSFLLVNKCKEFSAPIYIFKNGIGDNNGLIFGEIYVDRVYVLCDFHNGGIRKGAFRVFCGLADGFFAKIKRDLFIISIIP
jgi:hypothetical protein